MPTANAAAVSSSLCVIISTHSADLQRFALLRRSLKLFAAERYRHLALVNTEDYAEFRSHFGEDTDVEIIRSADLLPRDVEQRRRKSGPRRRTGRFFNRRPIKGWYAQQLMKLFALAGCPTDAAIFIDSDVFLCRP